jgi:ubiquitin carboxyl-terminal hydrolase 8
MGDHARVNTFMGDAGLENLGNTCYVNSLVQALRHTPGLRKPVEDAGKAGQPLASTLASTLATLFGAMEAEPSEAGNEEEEASLTIEPVSLIGYLEKRFSKDFVVKEQQDCQEVLLLLLEQLHEECATLVDRPSPPRTRVPSLQRAIDAHWSQKYSAAYALFQHMVTTRTLCSGCKHRSVVHEPSMTLGLDVPSDRKSVTLEECLGFFEREESLEGEDSYHCGVCNTRKPASRRSVIGLMPTVLVVHLKRFRLVGTHTAKIRTRVEYPEELELHGRSYHLYAVVCHEGRSVHRGHYYAMCLKENNWRVYNDEEVEDLEDPEDALDNPDAYLLFYSSS